MKASITLLLLFFAMGYTRVESAGEFAPAESWVKPAEKPWRAEVCLNGKWQFQPGTNAWHATPIKIPSPWNVNTWGCGRNPPPFWPDSVYFPSYPATWDNVESGQLRRTLRVPADWGDRRIVLHFEAVAGECEVFVNGQLVGMHFDKYLPFEFDITPLVKRDADNELLVSVRAHSLFDKQSQRYPKMRKPYPCGSETERLVGIWQDVYLLGLPPVRVADVFVKPFVDRDTLELEVTLRNDTGRAQTVTVGGEVVGAFALPSTNVTVGTSAKLVLRECVGGRLKFWSPDSPNLYSAVVTIQNFDRQVTRFGWRQFAINGRDLLLNGQKIQLVGDFLHPFGSFMLSPNYARAWYQLIKDFGGNAVRPHAQPHPRYYLDLADEMGIVVLDETAIFGSSIALNFEEPVAWQRFAEHYDGLVLRDRNHPSVLGWSFGNELFAIFEHNNVPKDVADGWYRQLAELGARARRLDPTRDWISCDGDEDLRGTLPVWSKHFGHGTPLDRLPDINKPLMVGESGGTYYARPRQLAEFNGTRAYESYAGRNEALAIDVYDNIVRMARPRLAFYSASETAWFGVEHLPFGYRDFTRLPGPNDGVFFTAPFVEGKPGIQPERLPPYVATLNPGWDPSLPLYKPLAMFDAQKAALAGKPSPWDHRVKPAAPLAAPAPTIEKVGFIGDRNGALARRFTALGVPLAEGDQKFTISDGRIVTNVGTVLVMLDPGTSQVRRDAEGEGGKPEHTATMLVPDGTHPWTKPFTLSELYFAEEGTIMRRAINGPGRVLLRASDTDWSLFNNAPEKAKCAAVLLGERLAKPSGAALVERGNLVLCSLDWRVGSKFWRKLFTNMGIKLGVSQDFLPAFDENGALVNATVDGRLVTSPSRDRFVFREMKLGVPESGEFAVTFSYWIRSPRALDDLLADGPDAPRFGTLCYASEQCRLFLNGQEIKPARTQTVDYRTLYVFEKLPLKKDWNHFMVKVVSRQLRGEHPATLAVRILSNNDEYLQQLETAAERKLTP